MFTQLTTTRCVYKNCNLSRKDGVALYKFPVKDADRCTMWAKNCGNEDVASYLTNLQGLKQYQICEKHFKTRSFYDPTAKSKKLLRNAVPRKHKLLDLPYVSEANPVSEVDTNSEDDLFLKVTLLSEVPQLSLPSTFAPRTYSRKRILASDGSEILQPAKQKPFRELTPKCESAAKLISSFNDSVEEDDEAKAPELFVLQNDPSILEESSGNLEIKTEEFVEEEVKWLNEDLVQEEKDSQKVLFKLRYFDYAGRGEPIRIMFNFGEIEFVDERISKSDWPVIKPTIPLGQLPVLEVDGKSFTHTTAICRYVASLVGLIGKDVMEMLRIDSIGETINELLTTVYSIGSPTDEISRKKAEVKIKTQLPTVLGILEDGVKTNNGFIASRELSWVDIFFLTAYEDVMNVINGIDILKGYPNLTELKTHLLSIKTIRDWIQKRPVTSDHSFDLKNEL